jgi:hypothetical protein
MVKKIVKTLLVVFLSVFVLFIAAGSVVVWIAFTPERISPIIRDQSVKYLNCQTDIGNVELTFFSTFPRFGLKVDNLRLINPVEGGWSDTLLSVQKVVGVIDVNAYWRRNEIILSDILIQNGSVYTYIDKNGKANFDIFPVDSTAEKSSAIGFDLVDLGQVHFKNVNFAFQDDTLDIKIDVLSMDVSVAGTLKEDLFAGIMKMSSPSVSFQYKGEKFLDNVALRLNIPAELRTGMESFLLKDASASVNDLDVMLDGILEMDQSSGNMFPNLRYRFTNWSADKLLALVPPSFQSYLQEINFSGILSSSGSITGVFNDSIMPLMDLSLSINKGTLEYADFPVPLSDISSDIRIYTNLVNDDISYVQIHHFDFKTPRSSVSVHGTLHSLFTDMKCSFETTGNLLLDEFNILIPDSLKTRLSGRINGTIKADFLMSHIGKMSLEKMRITGDLKAQNLDVSMDSIWLRTGNAHLKFSLPNTRSADKSTRFAITHLSADQIHGGKIAGFQTYLKNASFTVETSDVRDTTRIPAVALVFAMDTLSASNDTLALALKTPSGKVIIAPRMQNPREPFVKLSYNSHGLLASVNDESLSVRKLDLHTDIENDNSQTEVFLQWLVKGSVDLEEGVIKSSMLTHPMEIPAIKMNFDPSLIDIEKSRLVIDQSDFELVGKMVNFIPYFRGDSILRGVFNFTSTSVDILQLMSLTNGIGSEEEATVTAEESYSGPYMVPRGIDFLLTTHIEHASFGVDTATQIIGQLRVNDGVLLLDDYTFTTSAARMQLSAMYKTPRKNHLFLGLNYHMLDVEIEELLKIIPDIDTLMPMLRSFRGKGEFHLAIESYLDSTYTIKKSTLRGASSIKGQNLVLMDGETFSEIAKTLRFSKRAENIVDSLSAEFTIFREEIDIYPFMMIMDKYKAVISGRHNFDLTFDYHISVVDSPLPFRLGIDITGNMDNFKYKPTAPKFGELYRPASRRVVEARQLELRRLIRESLLQGVIQ